jgi:hypothetical protein
MKAIRMMLPLPKKHQTIAEDKNKRVFIVKREADASLFFSFLVCLRFLCAAKSVDFAERF